MITCTSCGSDVTGKKFCPQCGTPVQTTDAPSMHIQAVSTCPHCGGTLTSGAAFCMHCGSPVNAQPATRPCPACHTEVPVESAFCTYCGKSMQVMAPPSPAAVASAFCNNCGRQNTADMRFCGGCGSPLHAATSVVQSGQYSQYSQQQYSQSQQPYGQQQYPPQYQQNQQYSQYPQQYAQGGYQPQPMMGQQPMVLRCPVCMAMAPIGTSNCPSCRTSLGSVVPTPANMPVQGQQGGLNDFLQGGGGKMAMGALGGAAAVIGGEMLLHGAERNIEERVEGDRGYGYGRHRHHHRDEGLLEGLGDLANDVGLF